jgi:DNA-directed RNA polymerase specialized sigma24 family protein
LAQQPGPAPTPEFVAMVDEECERLLQALGDEELRRIAVWKLEGLTNEEIAERMSCITRTVERKLKRIRDKWTELKSM